MTKLYYVRHCEPNYNNHNDRERELTEKGQIDTALVTEYLADKDIGAVLSSPYLRAMDTVRPFAESRGLPIVEIEELRERRVDSTWIDDFTAYSKHQWEDFAYKFTDGECLREVQDRNISALRDILKNYEGMSLAIGHHGTALCTVINYFLPGFGFDDFQKIRRLFPWIVCLSFEGDSCVSIESYDPYTGKSEKLL